MKVTMSILPITVLVVIRMIITNRTIHLMLFLSFQPIVKPAIPYKPGYLQHLIMTDNIFRSIQGHIMENGTHVHNVMKIQLITDSIPAFPAMN